MSSMRIGIATSPNLDVLAPDRLAQMIKARGLESLWFAKQSHLPFDGHPPSGTAAGTSTPRRSTRSTAKGCATADVLSEPE